MKTKNPLAKLKAPTGVSSMRLLGCPWCGSEKIMSEGNQTGSVIAMVCQRCGARGPEDRNAGGYDSIARIKWNSHWLESEYERLRQNSIRDSNLAHTANDDLAMAMLELKLEKERNAALVKLVGKKTILKLWRAQNASQPNG